MIRNMTRMMMDAIGHERFAVVGVDTSRGRGPVPERNIRLFWAAAGMAVVTVSVAPERAICAPSTAYSAEPTTYRPSES